MRDEQTMHVRMAKVTIISTATKLRAGRGRAAVRGRHAPTQRAHAVAAAAPGRHGSVAMGAVRSSPTTSARTVLAMARGAGGRSLTI
eukprot:6009945-Prymnesium_polylepis.1